MPKIAIDQVTKRFPGSQSPALDELSLEIEDNEMLILAGPSGAGKTTLLRLIAGLDTPSGGRLLFDGVDVRDVLAKDRNVAMVFQTPALYPHMTAFQNMEFGLKLRGCPASERARRVHEMSERLGIAGLLNRRPGELSGGQAQRVALGRALVRRPEVLLLDEPFSNLDPSLRRELRDLVRSLHERAKPTTIWSTHDESDMTHLRSRLAVLKEGRLEQAGTLDELRAKPANGFVAGFVNFT